MSAARYVHPEFGFFCPTPRLRGLVGIVLVGAACAAIGMGVLATTRDPWCTSMVARSVGRTPNRWQSSQPGCHRHPPR